MSRLYICHLQALLCILVVATCTQTAAAQRLDNIVNDRVRFRARLDCNIRPLGAGLGYDMRFHHRVFAWARFASSQMGPIVRVRSYARALRDDRRRRYRQAMPIVEAERVFPVEQDSGGLTRPRFELSFPTGPGEYEFVVAVDNGRGRGCVQRWTSIARAPRQEPRGGLRLNPGEIGDLKWMQMDAPQREVAKQPHGIRACVLLHVENRYRDHVYPDWQSAEIAVASIRLVAEDPLVREIAVAAFSVMQQELFYEQGFQRTVDFLALADSYERIEMGRIAISQLGIARELAYFRRIASERRDCLAQSDLVLVISPWWRESLPHRDEVFDLLSPRARQTLAYIRPGRFRLESRHENTLNSWKLDDALRGAVAKAGGRIMTFRTPYELVDDIHELVVQALKTRDEASPPQQ